MTGFLPFKILKCIIEKMMYVHTQLQCQMQLNLSNFSKVQSLICQEETGNC